MYHSLTNLPYMGPFAHSSSVDVRSIFIMHAKPGGQICATI